VNIHEKYINRCIQLAQNGLGTTYPNPMVGSVLVYNDKIIGEGWHQKAGENHAEVNAIKSVKEESLIRKSTIYVSLEPCSHYGKTPPCSDLIIASCIKKVVIGCVDPFAKVSGRGIKKLLDAGCEVNVGVLETECKKLNKRFFTFHKKKRPFIILKWAQTENLFIAPEKRTDRSPVWITNKYSKQLVHKWRSEEAAILVGTNTAVADNPELSTRLWKGLDPVRVVLDKNLRIPLDSKLFNRAVKTLIFSSEESLKTTKNSSKSQSNVFYEAVDFEKEMVSQICAVLYTQNLQSVIVEGGSQTLQSFIDSGLWDEAQVFTGKMNFQNGVKAPDFRRNYEQEIKLKSDNLKIYYND
jgi:diaminohydroxyphosphoribosylaminopyrimidine deaminase/5-amino-6-(5-phosphoribosylamino)uracil reductase